MPGTPIRDIAHAITDLIADAHPDQSISLHLLVKAGPAAAITIALMPIDDITLSFGDAGVLCQCHGRLLQQTDAPFVEYADPEFEEKTLAIVDEGLRVHLTAMHELQANIATKMNAMNTKLSGATFAKIERLLEPRDRSGGLFARLGKWFGGASRFFFAPK
ncbi:hypothetical protein [Paludisphaera borealis]|uniref:Uncharacterized protein n=1 Tax=Paludisphaera borealis TaxID=1387353 RepID=A0A1U7CX76_9BACT|nr:hypothetical protein [Paludisphaera borealis]APW63521.1 hypothetical protein BSF38_05093 [Paludisphaera borealis]